MSLKDEILWYSGGMLWAVRPIGCAGPAVIPIEALRAWLGSYCIDYPDLHQVSPSYYADVAQNELIEALLAELEGLS